MIKNNTLVFDKVIFLGDYIDGFVESDQDMLYCLEKVIELKKLYKDKIILLLANHEFSYLGYPCSGHRFHIEDKINNILSENKHLFQICYAINDVIFSHAGLTNSWINKYLNHSLDDIYIKKNHDKNFEIQRLVSFINNNLLDLSEVGRYRSNGTQTGSGSCIWVDKRELLEDNLLNCHQVIGHTPVKSIYIAAKPQNKVRTNYLVFTDTFSTYRDGTIYGDLSYLIFEPSAKRNKGVVGQFKINYLST